MSGKQDYLFSSLLYIT